MFGGTPGMTEAELIDFIAEERHKANTWEEVLPDGTVVIRSSKTMKKEKREQLFPKQRISQEGPGRVIRTVDHPEYPAMFAAIREHHEEVVEEQAPREDKNNN